MTILWHYILTLGTYPDPASTDLRMQTFRGTLVATEDTGRSTVYEQLRDALAKEHPELHLENAVVIHSDIQPNKPTG
ncbi:MULTISPECIES: hypothetical protein [unclassified Streptomyces]|uniref:hypothetical protein n=1 Tax=unclassified Streptomyces TaxID=2593676 RepID=UPI0035DBC3B8